MGWGINTAEGRGVRGLQENDRLHFQFQFPYYPEAGTTLVGSAGCVVKIVLFLILIIRLQNYKVFSKPVIP